MRNKSCSNEPQNIKIAIFSENSCNNFDYISLTYGHHIRKQNCMHGTSMYWKIMVCLLGEEMWNINFVKIGISSQSNFIALQYLVIKNDQPTNNFNSMVSQSRSTAFQNVCAMLLHQIACCCCCCLVVCLFVCVCVYMCVYIYIYINSKYCTLRYASSASLNIFKWFSVRPTLMCAPISSSWTLQKIKPQSM
jgi:hypothetical protein